MDHKFTREEKAALEAMVKDILKKGKPGQIDITDVRAINEAMKGMDTVRDAFLKFQEAVQDTCVIDIIGPAIKDLADYFMTIHCILDGSASDLPGGEELMGKGKEMILEVVKERLKEGQ